MTQPFSKDSRDNLEAALQAFEAGRLEEARDLVDTVALTTLGLTDRYRAQSLMAEVRHVETPGQQERDYRRNLIDDPWRAFELARVLAETSDDEDERRRWRQRHDDVRERIRQAWRVEVCRREAPLDDCFKTLFYHQRSTLWLDDEGRRMVLVNALDHWLFIRVVDVERNVVVERISLRTPELLERPLAIVVDGDRLVVTGTRGGGVEIALGDWQVFAWFWQQELVPPEYTIEKSVPFPGSWYLWMEVRSPEDDPETYVVDLRNRRVVRLLSGGLLTMTALVGAGDCQVVLSGFDEIGTGLYSPDGAQRGTERILGCYSSSAAVAPDGRGLLFLVSRGRWQLETGRIDADHPLIQKPMEDRGEVLALLEASEDGAYRVAAEVDLGEAMALGEHRIATSLDEELCFVLLTREGSVGEIVAVAVSRTADGASLEVLYRLDVPYGTKLAYDRHARQVVAWVNGLPEEMRVLRLGREEPAIPLFDDTPARGDKRLPTVKASYFCGDPTGEVATNIDQLKELLDQATTQELKFMAKNLERQKPEELDVDHAVYMCLALRRTYRAPLEREELVEHLAERYPDHPGAALLAAEMAAGENLWDEVRERIGGLEPSGLDDGRARHFYHLKGLGFLHGGRMDQAFEAFERGAAYEGAKECQLEPLLHLTRPMADPPAADEWGREQPRVRQILAALRTADRQIAAGELEAARDMLEEPFMWATSDLQMTARLATVYLELPASDTAERFYRRLGLARFLAFLDIDPIVRGELFYPGLTWDAERLRELAGRVREALDEA